MTTTTQERFRIEDDNRIFDTEEIRFYIRERYAVEKQNNKLEDIARMVEKSAEPRMQLAMRIRGMKERT